MFIPVNSVNGVLNCRWMDESEEAFSLDTVEIISYENGRFYGILASDLPIANECEGSGDLVFERKDYNDACSAKVHIVSDGVYNGHGFTYAVEIEVKEYAAQIIAKQLD
ncbi:MAG TPA: hypothetical protein VI968_00185 [archaeon]|nr:hypothetical protein [archaeon]